MKPSSMADNIRLPTDEEEARMVAAAEASEKRHEEEAKRQKDKQAMDMAIKAAENSRKRWEKRS